VDVQAAIGSLRVVRRFEDRPITSADLAAILNAGRRASSSKNRQRWTFITVTDRERLRELSAVGPFAGHVAGAAAGVALVTPDTRGAGHSHSILWDLGLAAQNMILAGWSLGIGSCPATVYDLDLVGRLLGLPSGMTCEYLLSFGYPAHPDDLVRPLRRGGRRPLDEVVRREHW